MVRIDNAPAGENNWLHSLRAKLDELGIELDENTVPEEVADPAGDRLAAALNRDVNTYEDDVYEMPPVRQVEVSSPRQSESNIIDGEMVKTTCHIAADLMGCDFEIGYSAAGFKSFQTGDFVIPRYTKGEKAGKPQFEYIFRTDTEEALGVVSGAYPRRDGYRHVISTMEGLFPNTCTGISVFGAGERIVIAQELGDPIDLGGGDTIKPYLYTRASLNRTWSTQCIPKMSRISCENALGTNGALITVKATRNHDTRLTLEAEIQAASLNQADTLRRMAIVMKDQDFTDTAFNDMVEMLIPEPESEHQASHTRRTNKLAACRQAWRQEIETHGYRYGREMAGNMWLAYNAVQGAEQHVINSPNNLIDENGEKYRDQTIGLVKTLDDAKMPITNACESYLVSQLGGSDRYTELMALV